MLSKFLDPKNDVAFKKIFGTEKNKDILIHFLNDMLTFKENEPIEDVTFLKTVQDPEIAAQKTSIVDILCKDSKGNQYIVEIQVAKEKGFEKRAQYYAAKAYAAQTRVGGAYADLKEIIFLAISNFVIFPNKENYKSDHIILDKDSFENDLKDFSFTFLELPKFKKNINELKTIIEKWMYFFKFAEETAEKDVAQIIAGDDIIERAYEELNRFSWNEEELLIYDQAEKYEGAYIASMEQKYDEGLEKGEQIGLEKGEQIGLEKGLEKGKIEIALNMIKAGLDKEVIAQITGLSSVEIEKLY
ncbi:MAG: Rpn family recombination-promoting nuclease/putative transposase [Alphaproteobacteria bacterium]|nr:Rpn family recombination-promoting nuclease/putative transposase [Alphaproteobacteria bacterium]